MKWPAYGTLEDWLWMDLRWDGALSGIKQATWYESVIVIDEQGTGHQSVYLPPESNMKRYNILNQDATIITREDSMIIDWSFCLKIPMVYVVLQ